jgi:hypothetical protein
LASELLTGSLSNPRVRQYAATSVIAVSPQTAHWTQHIGGLYKQPHVASFDLSINIQSCGQTALHRKRTAKVERVLLALPGIESIGAELHHNERITCSLRSCWPTRKVASLMIPASMSSAVKSSWCDTMFSRQLVSWSQANDRLHRRIRSLTSVCTKTRERSDRSTLPIMHASC